MAAWIAGLVVTSWWGGPLFAQRPIASEAQVPPDTRNAAELLNRPVSAELVGVSRVDAIDAVSARAGVLVQYRRRTIERFPGTVTSHFVRVPLGKALDQILAGTTLAVVLQEPGKLGIVDRGERVDSIAPGAISGEIVDSATHAPIAQARVNIAGLRAGTTTNAAGRFLLPNIPAGTYVVTVRALGFRISSQTLTVSSNGTSSMRFVLSSSANVLSGVVTTATGVQQRREIGNDITVLNVDSILSIAPVSTMTDLLETRVPGLIVQHSSGQPGAPSRIRIRGTSSPERSNDPIIIVDGVRVFANQADASDAAVVNRQGPSALDQIDPSSIATIEVFKGPSASSMYGSDAGNGVLVITTKRGRSGRTQWSAAVDGGRTSVPGSWSDNSYLFGQTGSSIYTVLANLGSRLCSPNDIYGGLCSSTDSVVSFQALDEQRLSPLGQGSSFGGSTTVSGGTNGVTYSLTGSTSDETGVLRLPPFLGDDFRNRTGLTPPDWAVRPDRYRTWGTNGSLAAQFGSSGVATVTGSLLHSDQRSTLLGGVGSATSLSILQVLQGSYIDTTSLSAIQGAFFVHPFDRVRYGAWTFTNGVSVQYPLRTWLPLTADAGLNFRSTNNSSFTPRGFDSYDTTGNFSIGRGTYNTQTLNARTILRMASRRGGPGAMIPIGANLVIESQSSFTAATTDIPVGTNEPVQLPSAGLEAPMQSSSRQSTYGWYVAPTLNLGDRFFLSPGLRYDGGTASGSNAGFTPFPKIDISWVALDRSDDTPAFGLLTQFRPRLAFGVAGVQPGAADKFRLQRELNWSQPGGNSGTILGLATFGNTQLRPERSREFEGGFDIALVKQRATLAVTAYHKIRYDAILNIPVAPSAGDVVDSAGNLASASAERNIGDIRNVGGEVTAEFRVLDNQTVNWQFSTGVSKNTNRVLRLAPGVSNIAGTNASGTSTRITEGYPLFGVWAKPIAGFFDANGDGRIMSDEVRIADSAVYVGTSEPNYEFTGRTSISLFNGMVSVNTAIDYQNGLTQIDAASLNGGKFLTTLSDASAPLAQQAAVAAFYGCAADCGTKKTAYGVLQTVNMLRWQSLAVSYRLPVAIPRRLGGSAMSVALQGSNLALHTNYRGKDPNVGAIGNRGTSDNGELPLPREWRLRVTINR